MLAPWKESYDKSRQHIKKQRHHFADKGPHNQSYGFFHPTEIQMKHSEKLKLHGEVIGQCTELCTELHQLSPETCD